MPRTKEGLKEQKEQVNGEMWGIGNGNGNGVYGIWVLYCLIRALCLGRLKVQLLSLQESAEDNGSCHLQ